MLQKPAQNSNTKNHVFCLERRLDLWRNGEVEEIVVEINAILKPDMSKGNIRAAVHLLKESDSSGPLVLDSMVQTANGQETVREILRTKNTQKGSQQPCRQQLQMTSNHM